MWDQYLGYETFTLRYFIVRCRELTGEQFHQQFDIGHGTLYDTLVHIIRNLEVWTDLMRERSVRSIPVPSDTVEDCLARFDSAMADFADCVHRIVAENRLEDSYTDVLDNPPTRKTFSGTILHVLTHTTVHRWEMQHMLQRLGLPDLIEGDALGWDRRTREQRR